MKRKPMSPPKGDKEQEQEQDQERYEVLSKEEGERLLRLMKKYPLHPIHKTFLTHPHPKIKYRSSPYRPEKYVYIDPYSDDYQNKKSIFPPYNKKPFNPSESYARGEPYMTDEEYKKYKGSKKKKLAFSKKKKSKKSKKQNQRKK
jgi:hypothetical protein